MQTITIRTGRPGEPFSECFTIEQGGLSSGSLSWDEMLGQIAALTFPFQRVKSIGGAIYPMRPIAEVKAREAWPDDPDTDQFPQARNMVGEVTP